MSSLTLPLSRIAVLGLAIGAKALALDPATALRDYQLDLWRDLGGVAPHEIVDLAQLTPGYIWAATGNGLLRFDGYRFHRVPAREIPGYENKLITGLETSEDGVLFMGPPGPGLFWMKDGKFYRSGPETGLPADTIVYVITGGRQPYVGTRNGDLYLWRGGRFELHPLNSQLPREPILYIYEAWDRTLWLSYNGKLLRIRDGRLERLNWPLIPERGYLSIVYTRSGDLWLAGRGKLFRVRQERMEEFPLPIPPSTGKLAEVIVDRNDHVWIGVPGSQLIRIRGNHTEILDVGFGTRRHSSFALLEADDGTIWFHGLAGLMRLRDSPIVSLPRTRPELAQPLRLGEDQQGRLWAGAGDGTLFRLDAAGGPASRPSVSDSIDALAPAREGGLWAGYASGRIAHWDGVRFRELPGGKAPPMGIFRMVDSARYGLLIGTRNSGLWQAPTYGALRLIGLPETSISALLVTKNGRVLAGTLNGLFELDAAGQLQRLTILPSPAGTISALTEGQDGSIWIGTPNGLFRWRNQQIETFREGQGLDDSTILGIVDQGPYLWVAGGTGLNAITKVSLESQPSDGKMGRLLNVLRFSDSDGLPSAYLRPLSFSLLVPMRDGRLAVATDAGPAIVDPSRIAVPQKPPVALLDEVFVNGALQRQMPVTVPPGANRLEFHYTSIHLSGGPQPRFRYRLRGYQNEWELSGAAKITAFTNLPPGQYQFDVAAAWPGSDWGEVRTLATVRVQGFFYQYPLFYAAAALAAAGVIAVAFQLRTRSLRHALGMVSEERNRIARELHDTVLQSFLTLAPTLNRLVVSAPNEAARSSLRNAIRLLETSVADARRSIQGLRASGRVNRPLPDLLREIALRLAAPDGIPVELALDPIPPLAPRIEEQLYRIAGEALSNAIRHGQASVIRVRLQTIEDQLVLEISDNGRGFDRTAAPPAGHFGLAGMVERARQMGADLTIETAPGQGTSIRVRLPEEAWGNDAADLQVDGGGSER